MNFTLCTLLVFKKNSNAFQLHIAKSCKWSKRDFISESLLLRFAKESESHLLTDSSCSTFSSKDVMYLKVDDTINYVEVQFDFSHALYHLSCRAFSVMEKWTKQRFHKPRIRIWLVGINLTIFLPWLTIILNLFCFRTITSSQHQALGCWTAKRAATVQRTTWRWPLMTRLAQ